MPTAGRTRRRTPPSTGLAGLGDRVRRARKEAGLTLAQLGAPEYTRAHMSAIELGKIRPAVKTLEFIAGKLGKPTGHFLGDEEAERKQRERELSLQSVAALLTRQTATEALSAARALLDDEASPREVARIRLYAATALNYLSRGAEALADLTTSARIVAPLSDDRLRRAIDFQIAIAHRQIGDVARGRAILQALVTELDRSPIADQPFRMRILDALGAFSWDLGEHEAAIGYYGSALELAKDMGDVARLIQIYNGLAYAYRSRGDLEAATGYLQRALGATQVANDLAAAAIVHNALAVVAAERGHTARAYEHVDRAIEIAKVNGPPAYVPHYLATKAECAVKAKDWDTAMRLGTEALELADSVENRRAAAASRVVLAEVAAHSGDDRTTVRQLEDAAATYRGIGAKAELGETLMRLSQWSEARGRHADAQRYATKAYEATRSSSSLMGR